jgi:hypothetical protein
MHLYGGLFSSTLIKTTGSYRSSSSWLLLEQEYRIITIDLFVISSLSLPIMDDNKLYILYGYGSIIFKCNIWSGPGTIADDVSSSCLFVCLLFFVFFFKLPLKCTLDYTALVQYLHLYNTV